ncbi:WD40/YVTN/BNR-like repeat-containing protein [Herbidospora mongoliensis]|uniref:WD40/YVTN/BNR-like repeat-containing protein n=1 Tax=Herbidospora mongoliensis TaxID=688067 RepID=UPI0012F77B4C|nr:hypothetical protein [Herbidospora mongoliensis]
MIAAVLAGGSGVVPAVSAEASTWRYAQLPPRVGFDSFGHVAAGGPKDIWAAGSNPDLLEHFDGRRWRSMPRPSGPITALSAASPRDVWALTAGKAHRWDGKGWKAVRSLSKSAYVLLAAVPGGAWVSEQGKLLRYDGRSWRTVPTPAKLEIGGIHARGANDVWVVGRYKSGKAVYDDIEGGVPAVLHWNGRALANVPVAAPAGIRSVLQLDDVTVGKRGELWLAGYSVLDGDRLPVLHRSGSKWTTRTPPRTTPPEKIEPDGAGGVWFDYGLDQPLWRSRAGKWTKVAAPKPPPGRAFGLFTHPGSGVTAHIPGTRLLVRAGATHVSPGRLMTPETSERAQKSTDRMLMTGPYG